MSIGDDRDLVPLGTGFDIVKRGYSRTQVEEHLERLDGDLRLLAADRDAAVSQAADLARRLEQSRSEMDDLRGQIDRLSLPPTTLEGLSERLQRMLRLAQDEAAETRARADAEAGHIRARAEADATALKARYEQLIVDLDNRRQEMEAEHKNVLRAAHSEAKEITAAAERDRESADAEAERRRNQVEEDFEIAMASRRSEAMRVLAEQEASSKAESERRLRESAEEAGRVRAELAEERRSSTVESERRLREAREESARLVDEATTAAEDRLGEATDEAHRRVREATDEANRRINHAAGRVTALRDLRARVADQLYSARDLLRDLSPELDQAIDDDELDDDGDEPGPDERARGTAERDDADHGDFARGDFERANVERGESGRDEAGKPRRAAGPADRADAGDDAPTQYIKLPPELAAGARQRNSPENDPPRNPPEGRDLPQQTAKFSRR